MSTTGSLTTAGDLSEQPDEVIAADLIADPCGGYGRLREQAPVVRAPFMGESTWMVTRYAELRAMLTDPRFVSSPASVRGLHVPDPLEEASRSIGLFEEDFPYLLCSLARTDPPNHSRLRKLIARAFTVRRVAELRPRIETIVQGLLDDISTGPEPVDLIEGFCSPLPTPVICEMVGVPETERLAWLEWRRVVIAQDPEQAGPATHKMIESMKALVEARRAAPTDDLLSALIRVRDEDDDRLSDEELISLIVSLALGGQESTVHLIGNSILALLGVPDQATLLRDRPELWPSAVQELLRCHSELLVSGPRYAAEDVEIGGVLIKAGEKVFPALLAANYDPRQHTEPDRLDVARQPAGRGDNHLSFGHGAHYCLGAALVRQEAEVALRALFDRFPGLRLAVPEAELEWEPSTGFRRLIRLPVRCI